MDNRHQTEREYIRYHAATSGEHLVAGIHGLAHGNMLVFPRALTLSTCSSILLKDFKGVTVSPEY